MFNDNARLFGSETRKARDINVTLRRFAEYLSAYKLSLVLVLIFVVAGTAMQVAIPLLIGQAVDCYLAPGTAEAAVSCWYTTPDPTATAAMNLAGLGQVILLIVALYLGNAVLSGLGFYLMSVAGYKMLRNLQEDVFHHIHRLSLGYFTKHEVGDVMSRVTNDIDTLQQIIGFGLLSVVQGILLIVMIVLAMFGSSISYALVSLSVLPLMFIATRWFSTQARRAFRQARKEIGGVNANLQENIAAVREVQAFSRENENIEQFRSSNAANRDANIKAQAFSSALAPTLEALGYVSIAIVVGLGGYFILTNQTFWGTTISLGLIITFVGYVQQFNRPVQQIAVLWTNLQSAIAGGERIFDLMDEALELTDKPEASPMPPITGHVVYRDVWAAYNPDEPVLRGINLEAQPGQTIAIVGPTGAGKTTIINLLPRFWDVTAGSVLIDGHDVRDVTRQTLRQQMGIVLQDTFLFSQSVLENIRYGRSDASDEEVIAAAKLARAHDFITRLADGYDTVLGERGSGLSQGQRQLLAIARVALMDPRILILDEATSSVDTRTERQIQQALAVLLNGRTSFVIAHRLSTIRNADQVLVLDQGQLIEQGTHDELLAAQGFYYDLYMSQFRREGEAEPDPSLHLRSPRFVEEV
jgi:ATP-binding cassette, subfamily B, multidrug efflux pump